MHKKININDAQENKYETTPRKYISTMPKKINLRLVQEYKYQWCPISIRMVQKN